MLAILAGSALSASAGVPFGVAVDGNPVSAESLTQFRTDTGITPRFITFFLAWPASPNSTNFPGESIEAIRAAGAIPVITWEPWVQSGETMNVIPEAEILDGKWDPYLKEFARALESNGEPVWIRFAHEMNAAHYHWGFSDEKDFDAGAPFVFRRIYQYVVDAVRSKGATNIKWIFCPNSESIPNPMYDPSAKWNRVDRYYPGDDYVDLLGMDGYNWGTTRTKAEHGWDSRWQTFEEIFSPLHDTLAKLAPQKPILIFETATAGAGPEKAEWILAALKTAERWKLAGWSWFEVNKEVDWRLERELPPEIMARLQAANSDVLSED